MRLRPAARSTREKKKELSCDQRQVGGGGRLTPTMDQKNRASPHMDHFGASHRVKKKDHKVFLAFGRKKTFSSQINL